MEHVLSPGRRARVLTVGIAALDRRRVTRNPAATVATTTFVLFSLAVLATQYRDGGSGEWGGRYFLLGIPVIVSRRGNLPELAGDAGELIDPDDVESIVDALARIVSDDDLATALSARARERAQAFTWQRTAEAVRQVFDEVVRERKGAA